MEFIFLIILILIVIVSILPHKCPDCKSNMNTMFDPFLDKMIYQCKGCGKEWL